MESFTQYDMKGMHFPKHRDVPNRQYRENVNGKLTEHPRDISFHRQRPASVSDSSMQRKSRRSSERRGTSTASTRGRSYTSGVTSERTRATTSYDTSGFSSYSTSSGSESDTDYDNYTKSHTGTSFLDGYGWRATTYVNHQPQVRGVLIQVPHTLPIQRHTAHVATQGVGIARTKASQPRVVVVVLI